MFALCLCSTIHTYYSFSLSTPHSLSLALAGNQLLCSRHNVVKRDTFSRSIPAKYIPENALFNGEFYDCFACEWAVCMGFRAFFGEKKGECIEQEITFYDIYYVHTVVVSIYFSHSVCCLCVPPFFFLLIVK